MAVSHAAEKSPTHDQTEDTPMELKNRIWMTGNLEWFAYLGNEIVFLGRREVPYPLREGDRWTNSYGDTFQVVDGEIIRESVNPDFQNSDN
jgi:hypothetical protein